MKLSRRIKIGLTFTVMFFVALSLQAAPIDFSIINPNRIAVPGDIVAFDGTITNNTGAALSSTDLFLNFSGFDSLNVSLDHFDLTWSIGAELELCSEQTPRPRNDANQFQGDAL